MSLTATFHAGPRSRPASTRWRIDVGAATLAGVKRLANQDNYLVAKLRPALRILDTTVDRLAHGADDEVTLLAVADGVGSGDDGERASAEAIDALASFFRQAQLPRLVEDEPEPSDDRLSRPGVGSALENAFALGHARVEHAASRAGAGSPMASALTVAYLRPPRLYVAHVGGSRAYLLRDSKLAPLMREQVANEDIEQPLASFRRMLDEALGGDGVGYHPCVERWSVAPGDTLLLCTDGVAERVPKSAIASALHAAPTARSAALDLVARARELGGYDDMTALIARLSGR